LRDFRKATGGQIPLIGVGGIGSGADAYERIRAGASLVQIYSALVFHGPGLVQQMLKELAECLEADGFATVAEAVGTA
jgi:dihydroorotate dehydrogenase